uniref:ATP-dependent DNA helicase RecQ n=1 Tax=uncultured bacterium contig00027 TaxID=1181516 RepID=A0A806K1I8_9BACT|nr:ATP-dependent DNA helicase RecQ [uncultured bacterium contig00027]
MNNLPQELKIEKSDPLSCAVNSLFGLSYLFPYQRLVITNILEAAEAAGLSVKWPEQADQEPAHPAGAPQPAGTVQEPVVFKPVDDGAEGEPSDRECQGRQIVILPTGAGKSLCFQLPAMMIDGITLVIYPILSLMADQQRRLHERGFSPVTIRGGQSKEEREAIWSKLESGNSRFIIANPEVLLTAQVSERLKKIKIAHAVIDEAHCVSEWGESFRPSYLEIGSILNSLKPPLVTAFTATASSPVLEKIGRYIFCSSDDPSSDAALDDAASVNPPSKPILIVGNPDRPNISYSAKGCINRDLAVRDLIMQNARPAIVFCSSRPGTEKLSRYLRNEFASFGFSWHDQVRFYHAGLSREEKTLTEKWFINNREAVLCATCAYGMGVDKADVRTVIHRDTAPSVEAYLQESGRAGRDGEQSNAILLWGPEDERSLSRAKNSADRARISALLRYSRDTEHCRRHALLALLDFDANGEVPEKNCCDVCLNKASNGLREEKTILEFFHKNKRRFSVERAASVLSEANTVRWSQEDASRVIGYLLKEGKLKKSCKFFWKSRITITKE